MTDLKQRLHDTLDDQHTDLVLLAARAQSQGTRLRHRHRLTVATSSLAVVAVLATGAVSATRLLPGPEETRTVTGFASQGEATVPASGKSVAAAALAAVNEVADGTIDRIHGGVMVPITDDSPQGKGEVLLEHVGASFAFTPDGASSPGEVSVSISHTTDAGKSMDLVDLESCPNFAIDCQSVTLPDGSVVDTYRSHGEDTTGDPAGFGTVYAQRTIGDVVVTIWAANGLDSPMLKGTRLPNQPQTVLSLEQVKEIVSQPWWGLELPAEFSGDDLPSFELLPGGAGSL
jgi:hypothetical protein